MNFRLAMGAALPLGRFTDWRQGNTASESALAVSRPKSGPRPRTCQKSMSNHLRKLRANAGNRADAPVAGGFRLAMLLLLGCAGNAHGDGADDSTADGGADFATAAEQAGGSEPVELFSFQDPPNLMGITYANDGFYVLDERNDIVLAYTLAGDRDPEADIVLRNRGTASGIAYFNERFFVVDASRGKVDAYSAKGIPIPGDGFIPQGSDEPRGIVFADGRLFVVDHRRSAVFAYRISGVSGVRDSAAYFFLRDGNKDPEGIAYADGRLFVVDAADDKVYAYAVSGARVPAADFDLHADNRNPSGIAYADGRFFVADSSAEMVYAYTAAGDRVPAAHFAAPPVENIFEVYGIAYANGRFHVLGEGRSHIVANGRFRIFEGSGKRVYAYTASGARDRTADFELDDDNSRPGGIAFANGRFHILDEFDDKVYAYAASGARDPVADFELDDDNDYPTSIAYANGRFHVADAFDHKVYAYTASGDRYPAADFDLHEDNRHPFGIEFANGRFHVADAFDDKVYAYAASGARDPIADFTTRGQYGVNGGIAFANGRFFVVDYTAVVAYPQPSYWNTVEERADGARVERFDLQVDLGGTASAGLAHADGVFYVADAAGRFNAWSATGARTPAADLELRDGNRFPAGAAFADGLFHVVDSALGRVFAYTAAGDRSAEADFELHGDNIFPVGIAYANGGFLVVDASGKVYAYTASGDRIAEAEFDLHTDNGSPVGIAYANNGIFVLDSADARAYAYTTGGDRVPEADLGLHGDNGSPVGIAWAGGLFFVADSSRDSVYAYSGHGFDIAAEEGIISEEGFDLQIPDRYSGPEGVAWADGRFFVVDHTQETVYAYTASGDRVPEAGFDLHEDNVDATGIAHADGRFFVADRAGARVYAYTASGDRVPEAEFDLHEDNVDASGIAHVDGRFFVADRAGARVYAYTASGDRVPEAEFDLHEDNADASGIAHVDGRFFVADRAGARVYAYTAAGHPDLATGFRLRAVNSYAAGIAYVDGRFFIVDRNARNVYAYSAESFPRLWQPGDGAFIERFSLQSRNDNRGVSGIAYADGRFFVADSLDDKVYAYTAGGTHEPAAGFDLPEPNGNAAGIAASAGPFGARFYVVDRGANARVYVYAEPGNRPPFSGEFELHGSNSSPVGIAYADGNLYVVDNGLLGGGIKVYGYGTSGGRFPETDFPLRDGNEDPEGIAYADGRFFVVDNADARVYAYAVSGLRVPEADFDLHADNRNPSGIAYADGRLLVSDRLGETVYSYSVFSFAGLPLPPNLFLEAGTPIDAVTLPEASGAAGAVSYSLDGSVPGLNFDAASRRITGTPTVGGEYVVTYTATAADGDTATRRIAAFVSPTRIELQGVGGGGDVVDSAYQIADIAIADGRIFIVVPGQVPEEPPRVYAYTVAGHRVPEADFDLHEDNRHPVGIEFANGRFHVVDRADGKVYAYTVSGGRDSAADFDLAGGNSRTAIGIAYADGRFFVDVAFIVVDRTTQTLVFVRKAEAYTAAGRRVPAADFDFFDSDESARGPFRGSALVFAEGRFFLLDGGSADAKVWAYTSEGDRAPEADIELFLGRAWGIGYADGRLYVSGHNHGGGSGVYLFSVFGFAGAQGPGDRFYTVGEALRDLALPRAVGAAAYSLDPAVPGLAFDAATRRLTGVPSSAGTYDMIYTATAADGESAELEFAITVEQPSGGEASEGFDLRRVFNGDGEAAGTASGVAHAGGRLFIVDDRYGKVFAYTNSGYRDPASDFVLHSDNAGPNSIAFADGRFFVVDGNDAKVYAYTAAGERDPNADFALRDGRGSPTGIAYADGRFFVVYNLGARVFAYTAAGERDPASDFVLHEGNQGPTGIAHADGRFYVADVLHDKVFAYTAAGTYVHEADFALHDGNLNPAGIVFADGRLFVADRMAERGFFYSPPSFPDVDEPGENFSLLADGGNRNAAGVAFANSWFYVVDRGGYEGDPGGDRVYAYTHWGDRVPAAGFGLHGDNGDARGIAYADGRFFVTDYADGKVYAYAASGERDTAADFDLDGLNGDARGIAYADGRFFVTDYADGKVYAYAASGERDTAADFDLDGLNGNPWGIVYADGRFFVTDYADGKVYAYTAEGGRLPAADIGLHGINVNATGIAYADGRLWVADPFHDRIYAYSAFGFAGVQGPGDLTYAAGAAIDALTLPRAFGDNGTAGYSLGPAVPGLVFDAAARRLAGTPSGAGTYNMTYTATAADGETATLVFSIVVQDPPPAVDPPTGSFGLEAGDGNRQANGAVHAAGRLYVVDPAASRVFAYTAEGGRDPAADFDLHADNGLPTGIAHAGGRFFVVDAMDDKVYAYTASGQRDPGADFDLIGANASPTGIAHAYGRFFVADTGGGGVYAYTAAGDVDWEASFDLEARFGQLGGSTSPTGIAYAGGRFFLTDFADGKVYAYSAGGDRVPEADFDLRAGAGSSAGIAHAGGRLFVVNSNAATVDLYPVPSATGGGPYAGDDDHADIWGLATHIAAPSDTPGALHAGDVDWFRVDVDGPGDLAVYTSGNLDTSGLLVGVDGTTRRGDDGGDGLNFRIAADAADGAYYVRVTGFNDRQSGGYTLHARFTASETDTAPSFANVCFPGEIWYEAGVTIEPLALPAAEGGNGPLTYRIDGLRDGLSFDPGTRRVTGTPVLDPEFGSGRWNLEYNAVDADGDTGTILMKIRVESDWENWGLPGRAPGAVIGDPCGGIGGGGVPGGDDHGDDRASATAAGVGSDTRGALHAGDVDYFRIVLDVAGALDVYSSGDTDTYGHLEDAGGAVLYSDDDGNTGRNFRLPRDVPAGTYYVRVTGFNDRQSGGYTLHVRFTEAATGTDGGGDTQDSSGGDDTGSGAGAGTGGGPATGAAPSFAAAGVTQLDDLEFTAGAPIAPVILPAAAGGTEPLTYTLIYATGGSPREFGLDFDPATRRLTGTPTGSSFLSSSVPDAYGMTYTAADAGGRADTLRFRITIVAPAGDAPGEFTGAFTDSTGRSIKYRLHFMQGWDLSQARGVELYFHGNNSGTEEHILDAHRYWRPDTSSLDGGMLRAAVASPYSYNPGGRSFFATSLANDGARSWNPADARAVHELLQSDFDGNAAIDRDRIVFTGDSQGPCFINYFLQRYAGVYGGGFHSNCGCLYWGGAWPPGTAHPWSPTVPWTPQMAASVAPRFRVFVQATTGDHLYDDSVAMRDMFRDVLGFETRWDLDAPGGHCAAGATPYGSIFEWLAETPSLPRIYGTVAGDHDVDGLVDSVDPDDDNDGAPDIVDALPLEPGEWLDTDGDGIGDFLDGDADGDGVANADDPLPLDPSEWADNDADGIGDNIDADDDNDGIPDAQDAQPLAGPRNDQLNFRHVAEYGLPPHDRLVSKGKVARRHPARPSSIAYPQAAGGSQAYYSISLGDSADPVFEIMVDSRHARSEPCEDVLVAGLCAPRHEGGSGFGAFFESHLHLIYIDRNQNRNLTDDGAPLVLANFGPGAVSSNITGVSAILNVPYSTGARLPYRVGLSIPNGSAGQPELAYSVSSYWIGRVSVPGGGEPILIGAFDANLDGLFNSGTYLVEEAVTVERSVTGQGSPVVSRSVTSPEKLADLKDYACVDIDRNGELDDCGDFASFAEEDAFAPMFPGEPFMLGDQKCALDISPTGHTVAIECGDDHGDTPATATPVELGSDTPGVLDAGDTDWFRIDVGEAVRLEVYTSGRVDTTGRLEDAAGSLVEFDDDNGAGGNFKVSASVSAGAWYVRVRAYDGSGTGGYTLHVRAVRPTTVTTPSPPTGGGGTTDPPPPPGTDCSVGLLVNPGESCAYPGTNDEFTVTSDGQGRFQFVTAGSAIDIDTGNVSFAATHRGGGVWRIDRVGATVDPDTSPSFSGARNPGDQSFTAGTRISALTLPRASGGDGALTYSLSPGVPGLTFTPSTRRLEGTPTRAGSYVMTYAATDEDGDRDTLGFTISVAEATRDTSPSFSGARNPGDQSFTAGTRISALTLPRASGGDGALTYSLSPGVPGLTFTPSTRRLEGTPTRAGSYVMTYAATDEDGDRDTLGFTISVAEATRDTSPSFSGVCVPAEIWYQMRLEIPPLIFPAAKGGNEPLTYSLGTFFDGRYGLTFDPETRRLTGKALFSWTDSPLVSVRTILTVRDVDGDEASLGLWLRFDDNLVDRTHGTTEGTSCG